MKWIRYWKKSGANQDLSQTWKLHDDGDKEEDIQPIVEDWSEHVGGGFGSGQWTYGYEENCPPTNEWIDKEIESHHESIKYINEEITELKQHKGAARKVEPRRI